MLNVPVKYNGVYYKDLGRDYPALDCWGLSRLIFKDINGIDLPEIPGAGHLTEIPSAKHGCLALTGLGSVIAHSGVVFFTPGGFRIINITHTGLTFNRIRKHEERYGRISYYI